MTIWPYPGAVRHLCLLGFLALGVAWDARSAQYVVGWGDNSSSQLFTPPGLTNASAVTAGSQESVAAKADGSVLAWGCCNYQTNIPSGLSNVVSLAAGAAQVLALKRDGRITSWGYNNYGEVPVPDGLSNVMAIAAGDFHSLALRSNGTVVAWGYPDSRISVPAGLTNVIAIGGSPQNSLALKSDGTLVMWGPTNSTTLPPATLGNVIAISGTFLALKANHTVVAWGNNAYGQTNIPPGLTNVIAIAGNGSHNLALKADGTLVAWGYNFFGQTNIPPGLSNVAGITVGKYFSLALVTNYDGSPVIVSHPLAPSPAYSGATVVLNVGFEGIPAPACQWQLNGADIPGATNNTLVLSDPQTNASGAYRAAVTNSQGFAVSLSANLLVTNSAPVVIVPAPNQTAFAGSDFSLSLPFAPSGSQPLGYQWRFNSVKIPWATNAALTLTNIQLPNEGNYRLTVSNAYGSVTTTNTYVTVIDLGLAVDNQNLDWVAGGDAPWRPVYDVTVNASYGYMARSGAITNNQTSTLQTTVAGPGTLSFWWNSSCQANVDYVTFSVNGSEQARLTGPLSWHHDTYYLGPGAQNLQWAYVKGATGSAGQDAGSLDLVSYAAGAIIPAISVQPTNQNIVPGSNATLSVTALGTPPLAYQWQLNEANLAGATNSALVLTNVQPANNGNYRVIVSNPYGSTPSSNANLNVFLFVGPVAPQDAMDRWYFRSPATINRVRFVGNRFIGVGANGTLVTSEDGRVWTTQNSGTSSTLRGVAYGSAVFPQPLYVAVGAGTIRKSSDGTNWTQAATTSQDLYDVAWNGSRFAAVNRVAVSGQPNALWSSDGLFWTGATFPSNPDSGLPFVSGSIAADSGFFITAGGSQFADYIWRSANGSAWQNVGFSDADVQGIASSGSNSLVIGWEGWPRVSTNHGASWFAAPSSVIASNAYQPPYYNIPMVGNDIAFGNGGFLVTRGNGGFFTTTDGVNWFARSPFPGALINSVAYGKGTFVVVCSGGAYPAGLYQSESVANPWITARMQASPRGIVLTLSGETGRAYRLQTSTNLSTWADLWSYTNSSGGSQFFDSSGVNVPQMFYRAVSP